MTAVVDVLALCVGPLPPQRPIVINGHDRPLTMVKYNFDGDLLFSCSKSKDGSVYVGVVDGCAAGGGGPGGQL
jgi:hypothetical protein